MATYTTVNGDTFGLIARKEYGRDGEAARIRRANPGLVEPFRAGVTMIIPPIPGDPRNRITTGPADQLNETALFIDGNRFRYWSDISITRSIDSMDTLDFSAPFEPDLPGFRETFRPGAFTDMSVTVNGEPLFTGLFVQPLPTVTPTAITMQVSGYSTPGLLNDCKMSPSAYPAEFNDQTLRDIAETIAGIFGITVVFTGDPGAPFERVSLNPINNVLSFLSKLAGQRNFINNSTPNGELNFIRSKAPGEPVAVLLQGQSPLLSVTPSFNAQSMYSHVTGMTSTLMGIPGVQYTVKNPHLTNVVRPYVFNADDIRSSEVRQAVETKAGRMFSAVATYTISVSTWRDPAGNIWAPNTTLKLTAPGAMIYNEYEFLIKSVTLNRAARTETADIELVLPGSFSGQIPETLPWV